MTAPLIDPDLVTIAAAEKTLETGRHVLYSIEQRQRERGMDRGFPAPRVVGAKVRLWSLSELEQWWRAQRSA